MTSRRDWRYTHTDDRRSSLNSPRPRKLIPLWMELHQGVLGEPEPVSQPFNTPPKLPLIRSRISTPISTLPGSIVER
jgi:hypothetical protein